MTFEFATWIPGGGGGGFWSGSNPRSTATLLGGGKLRSTIHGVRGLQNIHASEQHYQALCIHWALISQPM